MDADKEYDDLDRRELTILGRWFWGTVVAVVATFLYVTTVKATEIPVYVFEDAGVEVRLMASPCKDARSAMILQGLLPMYAAVAKSVDSVWPMKDGTRKRFAGCWIYLSAAEALPLGASGPIAVVAFEDGGYGAVAISVLKKMRGQIGT